MDKSTELKLINNLYKRGFLLIKKSDIIPKTVENWSECVLPDGYILFFEKGNINQFVRCAGGGGWLSLCGSYCMDVFTGNMDFCNIAQKMAKKLQASEKDFFDYLDILNGRFVCIYSVDGKVYVLNDACGSRSVYYATNKLAIASHYNLLNEVVNSAEESFYSKFENYVKRKFAEKKASPWVMPGDLTPFCDIKLLLPNHKLEMQNMTTERFWPRENMLSSNIDDACKEISKLLSMQVESLVRKYKVYEGLTAGIDSRITMSATKKVSKEITFFTYHSPSNKNKDYSNLDMDCNFQFAKNLCKKENLNFNEIKVEFNDSSINSTLLGYYKKNHYHVHLPNILPYYSEIFTPDSIHLRSNLIEICRGSHEPVNEIKNSNDIISYMNFMGWYEKDECFNEAYSLYSEYIAHFLSENIYNYPVINLLYWEHRVGSWMSGAVLTISDFACDTYQLFNCRYILSLGMSLPTYYKSNNRSIIYDEILRNLWPELLNYGLPNNNMPLYDTVDKNQVGFFYTKDRLTYKQGNLYDSNRKPYGIYEPRLQTISFGFADNYLKKGDWCEIEFYVNVKKDISYSFQFIIKTFWFLGVKAHDVNYEIIIDEKVVYTISTTDYFSANQILYCFKATDNARLNVKIRLVAIKDINSTNYCGMLDIILLDPKQDFGHTYSYQPKLIDTFSLLKE